MQIHEGRFKALVELSEGRNVIEFRQNDNPLFEFEINYQPQTNPHYVRVIWMTDSTGDTDFAAPNEDVPQDYETRLRTAAELMQTFTAERMNDRGSSWPVFSIMWAKMICHSDRIANIQLSD